MAKNNLVDHGNFLLCAANYIIHVIAEDDCQIYYMCLNFVSQDVCKEIAPGLNNTWTITLPTPPPPPQNASTITYIYISVHHPHWKKFYQSSFLRTMTSSQRIWVVSTLAPSNSYFFCNYQEANRDLDEMCKWERK